MDDDMPTIDQTNLIRYIQAALDMDGIGLPAEMIERVLDLEVEYLQHLGIAEQALDDPRPE